MDNLVLYALDYLMNNLVYPRLCCHLTLSSNILWIVAYF